MDASIERAVVELTQTHSILVDGKPAQSLPLLTLLFAARYPNLGRTKHGRGSGIPFDVEAVALYEHIEGVVRSRLSEYREPADGLLEVNTTRLHQRLLTEHAGGRLEHAEHEFGMFTRWVTLIRGYLDPPHMYELTATCPECGVKQVTNNNSEVSYAVRAQVHRERALAAECTACKQTWIGIDELIRLAVRMGVQINWERLSEFHTAA